MPCEEFCSKRTLGRVFRGPSKNLFPDRLGAEEEALCLFGPRELDVSCLLEDPGRRVELSISYCFLPFLFLPFKSFLSPSNIGDHIQFSLCQNVFSQVALSIRIGARAAHCIWLVSLEAPRAWAFGFGRNSFWCHLAVEWILYQALAFPECVHIEPGGVEVVIWGRNCAVQL